MLCISNQVSSKAPLVTMRYGVLDQIMNTIGARPAETGGILLGPVGSDIIDDFYFDSTAGCTRVTYSPDHVALREKMTQEWIPSGRDMKGFVHSHPGTLDRPSGGDLAYIARLLECNPDMEQFVAPILIPSEFRIGVFVVRQEQPHVAICAELRLYRAS